VSTTKTAWGVAKDAKASATAQAATSPLVDAPKVVLPPVVFKKLSGEDPTKYLKFAVTGRPKTGKSRFALSCPGPIYVIETEPGLPPLAKLFPDKEIYFVDVYEPDYTGTFEVDATKTLAKIDSAVRQIRELVINDPKSVGTVVLDSVTDIWKWVVEWMKLDILKIDKTARVRQQWDYGYANTKYQNIIMQIISLPTHVVLTAQDKEEYAGAGQPSGQYEPSWMWQTPQWVDIQVNLCKLIDMKNAGKPIYKGTVKNSRHSDEDKEPIDGKIVDNPCFDNIKALVESKKKEVTP
jgi:hypothetical protein